MQRVEGNSAIKMHSDLEVVLNDFMTTLEEVSVLLLAAEACTEEEVKYAAYNKSALLLLSGKFENFIEVLAEQYLYIVNGLKLRSSLIPKAMRIHHTLSMLDEIMDFRNAGKYDEIIKRFPNLNSLWVADVEFGDLRIECKFNYGKHGESELKQLFAPFGIDDIFSEVEVFIHDENASDGFSPKKIDFKGVFNSVMWMRNNILHQNASPSLTHRSIGEYKIVFESFSKTLIDSLDNKLNELIKVAGK